MSGREADAAQSKMQPSVAHAANGSGTASAHLWEADALESVLDEADEETLLELAVEQYLEMVREGELIDPGVYADQFPPLRDRILELLSVLLELEHARLQADASMVEPHTNTGPTFQVPVDGGGWDAWTDVIRSSLSATNTNSTDTPENDWASARAPERLNDYRIVRLVGRGGMGEVYEAEQQSLGRRVALKMLTRAAASDLRSLERFLREAQAAAQLHHPNIVPVYEVGHHGETPFYAMQFVDGFSIDRLLNYLEEQRLHRHSPDSATHAQQQNPTEHQAVHGNRLGQGSGSAPLSLIQLAEGLWEGRYLQQRSIAHVGGNFSPWPGTDTPHDFGRFADPSAHQPTTQNQPVAQNQTPQAPHIHLNPGSDHQREPGQSPVASKPLPPLFQPFGKNRRRYYRSVAWIACQVADALAYAHVHGIIHRDIKPGNILLDHQGRVWVTDFGLAKTEQVALTSTGDIVGTLRYIAPERFRGFCDFRADVYSLGITLWEMVTFKPAFGEGDDATVIDRITREELLPPERLDPQVPVDLQTIILKAAAKLPEQRYASAQELSADLRRFLSGQPILARRTGLVGWFWQWQRQNRTFAILGGAVALGLGLATLASPWLAMEYARRAELAKRAQRLARAEADLAQGLNDFWRDHLFGTFDPSIDSSQIPLATLLPRADQQLTIYFRDRPILQAHARVSLAQLYQKLGQIPAALAQVQQAIALFEQHDGVNEVPTLQARTLQATLWSESGQKNEAFKEFEDLGVPYRHLLGDDRPETWEYLLAYIKALRSHGSYHEADLLLEELLQALAAANHPDDPTRLPAPMTTSNRRLFHEALFVAAEIDLDRSQINDAIAKLRQLKKWFEQENPTDIVDLLRCKRQLALALAANNQIDAARALLEPTLWEIRRQFGDGHPWVRKTMRDLVQFDEQLHDKAKLILQLTELVEYLEKMKVVDLALLKDRLQLARLLLLEPATQTAGLEHLHHIQQDWQRLPDQDQNLRALQYGWHATIAAFLLEKGAGAQALAFLQPIWRNLPQPGRAHPTKHHSTFDNLEEMQLGLLLIHILIWQQNWSEAHLQADLLENRAKQTYGQNPLVQQANAYVSLVTAQQELAEGLGTAKLRRVLTSNSPDEMVSWPVQAAIIAHMENNADCLATNLEDFLQKRYFESTPIPTQPLLYLEWQTTRLPVAVLVALLPDARPLPTTKIHFQWTWQQWDDWIENQLAKVTPETAYHADLLLAAAWLKFALQNDNPNFYRERSRSYLRDWFAVESAHTTFQRTCAICLWTQLEDPDGTRTQVPGPKPLPSWWLDEAELQTAWEMNPPRFPKKLIPRADLFVARTNPMSDLIIDPSSTNLSRPAGTNVTDPHTKQNTNNTQRSDSLVVASPWWHTELARYYLRQTRSRGQ